MSVVEEFSSQLLNALFVLHDIQGCVGADLLYLLTSDGFVELNLDFSVDGLLDVFVNHGLDRLFELPNRYMLVVVMLGLTVG